MSAVITSFNVIYRAQETRPWWKQKLIILGLTIALAGLIIVALVLVLYGGKLGEFIAAHVDLGRAFQVIWPVLSWLISFAAMFLSYSIIYYFGPNLEVRKWYWVTPGAVVGVSLWLIASLGFRVYLHFFNSYSATYGSVGAVVILMLWLYITGFAILIGAEVNWIIENEDKRTSALEKEKRQIEARMKAA
jgi:membrane protein